MALLAGTLYATSPRPRRALAAVCCACFLALLLPSARASDYDGDYALYSGYHSGCQAVKLGIEGPGVNVTGGVVETTTNVTDGSGVDATGSVLYARFHVRTPSSYQLTRLTQAGAGGGTPHTSKYYTLFTLGGSGERGEGGYFGGFKAQSGAATETGILFFGQRGATPELDVVLSESSSQRLNGENTRVEFAFALKGGGGTGFAHDCSSLSMYADGELVLVEPCVALDQTLVDGNSAAFAIARALSGPLSIGAGGHDKTNSPFVDPFQDTDGGCFSPNKEWTNELARGTAEPVGDSVCGAKNRWGELDGGDVLWCPSGWDGQFPDLKTIAARAGFDPRQHDCEAVAYAPAAPMYSGGPGLGDEKWQRNNMALGDDSHRNFPSITTAYDEAHVNLRRLGKPPKDHRDTKDLHNDWWGDRFVYARFRFATPEHFGRVMESNPPGERGFSARDAGKIRLMSLDQDEDLTTDTYVWHDGGVCVSLFPVFPEGRGSFSPTRQLNTCAKLVLHDCGETSSDTNYVLDRPDALLEPSTSYLMELKLNFKRSVATVQVYMQGVLVDEAPLKHFPCAKDGHASCGAQTAGNNALYDDIPHVLAFGDNSHHVPTKAHYLRDWFGVEGFAEPLSFVGGGAAAAFRTSWGGFFSQKLNPNDESCVRDDRCYRLTSPLGTWGTWGSGEMHFCNYSSAVVEAAAAFPAPRADRAMFKSQLTCAGCYPVSKETVFVGLFFQGESQNTHGGIDDDAVFRISAASMGGADALDETGAPTAAGFVKLPANVGGVSQTSVENTTTFLFWVCDDVSYGKGTLLMHAVRLSTENDTVVAASAGTRRLGRAQGASACVGGETAWNALVAWSDPGAAASSATSVTARGVNAPGFGVHQIEAQVWSPADVTVVAAGSAGNQNNAVFTQTETVSNINVSVVAATIGGSGFKGSDLGWSSGGGSSAVHVLTLGETLPPRGTASCGSGPTRRRQLLRAPSDGSSRGGRELLQNPSPSPSPVPAPPAPSLSPPLTVLVARCHYPLFAAPLGSPFVSTAASPTHDLSGPATLVVVMLNVTNTAAGGTAVAHAGAVTFPNVTNCHYEVLDKQDVIDAWNCGSDAVGENLDAGAVPFGVTQVTLVRAETASQAFVKTVPVTGPPILTKQSFEGECACPTCYERFGFGHLKKSVESAARDAAFAAGR